MIFTCSKHKHLTAAMMANAVLNGDPTRTKTFRDAWSGEMYNRLRKVKGDVRDALITADVLGLGDERSTAQRAAGLEPWAWATDPPDVQMRQFGEWLQERMRQPGYPLAMKRSPDGGLRSWMFDRIKEPYIRGVERAVNELQKHDLVISPATGGGQLQQQQAIAVNAGEAEEDMSITLPPDADDEARKLIQQDTISRLSERALGELKNVTSQMAQGMQRELADGIAQGLNPRETARNINKTVDNVGIKRARLIARTETIRAYNEGSLDAYEQAGMDRVTYQAEWSTAGDARVCPACRALEGSVFKLSEMRGRIPLHPLCRCAALPVPPSDDRYNEEIAEPPK